MLESLRLLHFIGQDKEQGSDRCSYTEEGNFFSSEEKRVDYLKPLYLMPAPSKEADASN